MREQLINDMDNAIAEVKQWPKKNVQIFHHNDSDGLSSGAILNTAFERAGLGVRRFCLECGHKRIKADLAEIAQLDVVATNAFNYELLGESAYATVSGIIDRADCYRFVYSNLDDAVNELTLFAESGRAI